MSQNLKTYQQITSELKAKQRQIHLLLGNGFSMAYNPEIFSYNALHNFISSQDNLKIKSLFDIVKTKNFELVMQQLDNFIDLARVFGCDKNLESDILQTSQQLKESLIDAVEALHPEHVFKLSDDEINKCARFLSPFISSNGNIFSTNYDILLYWVLLRKGTIHHIDGFGRDIEDSSADEPEFSELRWGLHRDKQNIHYLHGSLLIFDQGIHITKEQYTPKKYILENIKERIHSSQYPIFVASGNGDEKLSHILHNRYLTYCYDALYAIEGSLITFGFNFGEYDEHIINAINIAAKPGRKMPDRLLSIYIGVYSEDDRKHIERIKGKFKCKVNLFDAKTVPVWR